MIAALEWLGRRALFAFDPETAHGLSLAQRRFLTLLDSACSVDEIAQRHRCEADKLERDLARLATLGLVACEEPAPANDPSAVDAALADPFGCSRCARALSKNQNRNLNAP